MHLKHRNNKQKKLIPAKTNIKLQNPDMIACYDTRPGNGTHLFQGAYKCGKMKFPEFSKFSRSSKQYFPLQL